MNFPRNGAIFSIHSSFKDKKKFEFPFNIQHEITLYEKYTEKNSA